MSRLTRTVTLLQECRVEHCQGSQILESKWMDAGEVV